MHVQRLRKQITMPWHSLALYGGMLGLLGAALYWRLGSLLPGYHQAELQTYQASLSLETILDNPLNAPFLIVVKALTMIIPDNLIVVRLAATLFGLITLILFAILLRRWHGTRTAILGTLLFGLSAWFLHTARFGTPEILLFGVFALAVCGFWLKQSKGWLAVLVCFLVTASLLYVPGMIWFIAVGAIWQWKALDRAFKRHLPTVTIGGLAMLGVLSPLAWALYKDHSLIRPLLGLPQDWPAPFEMARNVLEVPFHFFVRAESNPAVWLGTAPVLDMFSLTMFILGGYLYLRHIKLARTPLFMAIFAVTLALMVIGSPITYTIIIPFAYLIIAAGVSYLFDQWFVIFPRNPIARSIGWVLIGILVALVGTYHLVHYFVGWPHASATHAVYTIEKP